MVDDGLVYLDAAKLDRARVAAGMSLRDLATQSNVAWNTLRKLAAGEGVFPHVAHKVAVTLKRDVLSMLAERDPRYEPPLAQLAAADWEWELDEYLNLGRLPKVRRQPNVKALAAREERQQRVIVERVAFSQAQTQSSRITSSGFQVRPVDVEPNELRTTHTIEALG